MRWTSEQLAAYRERTKPKYIPAEPDIEYLNAADEPESSLQRAIEIWCEESGLPYFHDRSRGKNAAGFPDLVIALRSGRTLWLELKSRDGRLRKEQEKWRLQLMALGHEHHVVRSFKQFLVIFRKENKS